MKFPWVKKSRDYSQQREKFNLEPQFIVPIIDIKALWRELISKPEMNTKATQTKRSKKQWFKDTFNTNQLKSNWFKIAFVSFALLVSSSYDVISDGLLADSFINGQEYIKNTDFNEESKYGAKKTRPRPAGLALVQY